ncbi:hypothetical protein Q7P37_004798 [Cladosporium fusiforme]
MLIGAKWTSHGIVVDDAAHSRRKRAIGNALPCPTAPKAHASQRYGNISLTPSPTPLCKPDHPRAAVHSPASACPPHRDPPSSSRLITTPHPTHAMLIPPTCLWLAACVLLVAPSVTAQDIRATDSSPGTRDTSLTISRNDDMVPLAPVLPLTDAAVHDVPPTGLSAKIVLVTPDNQLDVKPDQVALISCDNSDYPGNIDQADVFLTAVARNVTAVLFYSREADYCEAEGDLGSYKWIFTMKSRNDTTNVLSAVAGASDALWVTIGGPEAGGRGGASSGSRENDSQDGQEQGPLGPNPSTAVAMIILYTITGVITALFLVIIITGAVRAHRHPERYGPRAMIGRPRQSRARGIGRAILDGIPIVKFGEQREEPKPTDVELGTTASSTQETARNADASETTTSPPPTTTSNLDGAPPEDGIAAAGAATTSATAPSNDTQGCSICTEDFELGQDQRVLPCDHRFHPDCIDPWLLNVSGTCPLCRVDLRPKPTPETDEHGNPIPRSDSHDEETLGDLPPPIEERSSVRRSLMVGILGIRGRPDRMTRDERILALRRYRDQQAARRRRETGSGSQQGGGGEASDDRRVRRRLRTLMGIRTRRVGREGEEVDAAGDGNEAAGTRQ